ncbi:DNA lyase [bacterium]|nr:DNA lyase [bacterium]RQV99336.1 MAG: DNA lyase [bacterium]
MRLWTFHPQYLDARGLTAVWREALLARQVLLGQTRGYTHHPQLIRFRKSKQPIDCIHYYLQIVYEEANRRGYIFDRDKIGDYLKWLHMTATKGQLFYEWNYFKKKIQIRNNDHYQRIKNLDVPDPHPLFRIISGPIETWEKITLVQNRKCFNGLFLSAFI